VVLEEGRPTAEGSLCISFEKLEADNGKPKHRVKIKYIV
jgi:hypothetical protein